jgi:DNA-binding LacI/PurR family transcriptional regulator
MAGSIAAVICEDSTRVFSDPYFARVLHGARRALGKGTQLVVLMAGGGQQAIAAYLRGGHAAGVLLVSTRGDLPLLHAAAGVPVVLAGRPQSDSWIPHVDIDDRGGARTAVEHLLASGRKSIGTIAGPPDTVVGADRLVGYRDAVAEAGLISSGLIAYGDLRQASGEHAMNRLLDRWPTLDAVLVASDLMAAGALRALHRARRRVPEDVAVIGFGDSAIAQHLRPRLTTVRQPLEEMGARSTHELLGRISGKPVSGQSIVLSTKLIIRESA